MARTDKAPFATSSGRVVQALADELSKLEIGDRLPPVATLAEKHRVGVGTIQKVLDLLQSRGCIELRARGHLGTVLCNADWARLWEIHGYATVSGVMPLPFSRRYEGLATGLCAAWSAEHLSPLLTFRSGAMSRLHSLASTRHDFAIMSAFACETAIAEGRDLRLAVDFGPGSYGEDQAVFFAPGQGPAIRSGYRVGIDESSFDQVAMTRAECGDLKVELVPVGYLQLWEALSSGVIHAAVWDSDVQGRASEVTSAPLTSGAAKSLLPRVTTAVAVTTKQAHATFRVLQEYLSVETVRKVQEEVMAGDRLPSY
jgi:YhfZ C-terminal domain/Helix-turn-helix domain